MRKISETLSRSQQLKQQYFSQAPKLYLECATPNGGKFWEVEAGMYELRIRFGSVNQAKPNLKVIPLSKCRNNCTVWEMMVRAEDKFGKGYSALWQQCNLPII